MKLVTYQQGSESRSGLLVSRPAYGGSATTGDQSLVGSKLDTIIDLSRSLSALDRKVEARTVLQLIEHGTQGTDAARDVLAAYDARKLPETHDEGPIAVALGAVTLLAPIPRPPSMRDGYAFRQHVETARRNRGLDMIPEFDQFPVFYFTNHQAVVGPGPVKVRERHLERLDFELEAAIVVGREGRDLSAKEADDYIFGMTIMNDFSARALQMQEMTLSLGPAKGKDFATGLGPWLVTMDELKEQSQKSDVGFKFDLGMRAFVNDVQVSTGNVKDMNWTFAQILERASYGVTLYPGDVIGSGTCGTGCFLELNGSKITKDQWLKVGDKVVLEIDRLGRLENTIAV